MEITEKLLNLLYAEWLKTNDPHTEDFDNWIFNKTGLSVAKLDELNYTILTKI